MKRRLIPAAAILATATAMYGGLSSLPAHASGPARDIVPGVAPSWATSAADRGMLADSAIIHARVYLASRDQAGLTAFVAAVSTPGNALYHQYLTPAQTAARFGSSPGAAQRVAAWLRSNGLSVTRTNGYYVAFHGTAAQVGRAFATSFHQFSVKGKTAHSPLGRVTVPSSIASDVLTVTGLATQLAVARPTLVSDSGAPLAGRTSTAKTDDKPFPCSAYEGEKQATKYPKAYGKTQPFAVCGYGPQQLNGAYGAKDSGFTGKGITVVVTDAYALPTMAKDLHFTILKESMAISSQETCYQILS